MKLTARIPVTAAMLALLLGTATGCNRLKARDQLTKGVQAFKNARYEEAVNHFQNSIALDPNYAHAHAWKACVLGQTYVHEWCTDRDAIFRQVAAELERSADRARDDVALGQGGQMFAYVALQGEDADGEVGHGRGATSRARPGGAAAGCRRR